MTVPMRSKTICARSGMTLIELLIAILVGGAILASTATLVSNSEETQSPMLMPKMAASEYIKVDIYAVGGPDAWTRPVSAYFRRESTSWSLVGFERQP